MINQNYQIMFYHITHINNKNITISASTGFQELFGLMMAFTRLPTIGSLTYYSRINLQRRLIQKHRHRIQTLNSCFLSNFQLNLYIFCQFLLTMSSSIQFCNKIDVIVKIWLAKNCVVFLYQTPLQIYPAVVSQAPYSSERLRCSTFLI